jgi:hypothetical protein
MKEDIQFKDMTGRRYVMVLCLAIGSLILAATLYFLNLRLYRSIAALVGITLFYVNSFEGFTSRNSVSHSSKSITISLLGRKTFGFPFKELEVLDLSEKGLYIKVKEMDAVTLSRKRYNDSSLTQLHTILKEKTTAHERR